MFTCTLSYLSSEESGRACLVNEMCRPRVGFTLIIRTELRSWLFKSNEVRSSVGGTHPAPPCMHRNPLSIYGGFHNFQLDDCCLCTLRLRDYERVGSTIQKNGNYPSINPVLRTATTQIQTIALDIDKICSPLRRPLKPLISDFRCNFSPPRAERRVIRTMTDNGLTTLPAGAFDGMPNLQIL